MSRWTIRQRVVASFVVIVVSMVAMAGVAYSRLARVTQETQAVQLVSIPGLYYSMALADSWSDNFALTEEYITQTDAAERERTDAKIQDNRAKIETILSSYESTNPPADARKAFDTFKGLRAAYL